MEPGMKKIAVLLLVAGMLCAVPGGASAIDFSAKGRWAYNFSYGQHGNFTEGGNKTGYSSGEDEFEAAQQVRPILQRMHQVDSRDGAVLAHFASPP